MYAFKFLVLSNLGSCPRCIRVAFVLAICVGLAAFMGFMHGDIYIQPLLWTLAALAVLLWFAHVLGYATRHARETAEVIHIGRRSVLAGFLKSALVAVSVSLPGTAYAWSSCGGWSSGDCGPCEKRMTANSRCVSCTSCGNGCGPTTC